MGHGTRENGKGTGKGLNELFAGTNKNFKKYCPYENNDHLCRGRQK